MNSPSDVEQIQNPWRSNSTATRQQGDVDVVYRRSAIWRDRDMILSPSPPPRSTMQETDTPTDPRTASLKSIFPDFDDAVILSVLESTDNDHDRALDALLGMSDPSFVAPTPPLSQARNELPSALSTDAQRLSQEALDEQLARRLALEEQQAAATQAWQSPQAWEGQTMYQPYQSHRGGRTGSWSGRPQAQGQGGRDTMTEFQEGFNRIAESGKKTFSSIVSKVKAKMQEFEQGQGLSGSQNPPPSQTQQSGPSPYYPSYPSGQQQGPAAQGAYYQPPYQPPKPDLQRQSSQSLPARSSPYASPPRSGALQTTATLIEPASSASPLQSSYYDPNSRGYDLYGDGEEDEIQITDSRTSSAVATTTAQSASTPLQMDRTITPPPPPSESGSFLPSYKSPVPSLPDSGSRPPSTSPPSARSLSPAIAGIKGTTPSAPGGVDFSKLGLLPKRPISLVRPQSPPVASTGVGAGVGASVTAPRVAVSRSEASSSGTEEPEFVENPFEDQ